MATGEEPPHLEGVVGVLTHTAAHAAAVVGHDPANHARVNGGGVRAHFVLDGQFVLFGVGSQQPIDLSEDQSWLDCDAAAVSLPVTAAGAGTRREGGEGGEGD
jgi:hypothetical protein